MSEQSAVQNPLIKYVSEKGIGWEYVNRDKAIEFRRGETGLFFYDLLKEQLVKLNSGIVDETKADGIIKDLENVRSSIEGNSETLLYLKGDKSVYNERERREINIKLIDFVNFEKKVKTFFNRERILKFIKDYIVFFRKDDEKGYLDKYTIAESIEDGTTVKLHYALAPSEIRVPQDMLEKEFYALMEQEGVTDVDELNKLLERSVNLRNFLKSDERVQKVAEFVAKHYRENVEPMEYKAFLVAVDREACALYKKELDKHLPAKYSTVVYSKGHNDTDMLTQHYLTEEEEKRLKGKIFPKKETLPKILIVTDKLLTGYDAPILYCMYLDKEEIQDAGRLAVQIEDAFKQNPHWKDYAKEARELTASLYKILLKCTGKDKAVGLVDKILKIGRK